MIKLLTFMISIIILAGCSSGAGMKWRMITSEHLEIHESLTEEKIGPMMVGYRPHEHTSNGIYDGNSGYLFENPITGIKVTVRKDDVLEAITDAAFKYSAPYSQEKFDDEFNIGLWASIEIRKDFDVLIGESVDIFFRLTDPRSGREVYSTMASMTLWYENEPYRETVLSELRNSIKDTAADVIFNRRDILDSVIESYSKYCPVYLKEIRSKISNIAKEGASSCESIDMIIEYARYGTGLYYRCGDYFQEFFDRHTFEKLREKALAMKEENC